MDISALSTNSSPSSVNQKAGDVAMATTEQEGASEMAMFMVRLTHHKHVYSVDLTSLN